MALICALALPATGFFIGSPVLAAPVIYPTSLPQGQVGVSYSATLVAAGGTSPYTWLISTGTLPAGLTLGATTGTISGIPTTAGAYSFVVTVVDYMGASSAQPYTINVSARRLIFSTTTLPQGTEGTSYRQTISVTGGTPPYTWEISSGTLPSGLSLNLANGIISGTPDQGTAGTYSFTVTVTDSSTPQFSSDESLSLVIAKGSFKSTITIGPGLLSGQTRVFVEGVQVASLSGGQSTQLKLDLGTSQTVSVDPVVSDPEKTNVRYRAQETSLTISADSPHANFNYHAEYEVDLRSDPTQASPIAGSGWYKAGYVLTISAPTPIDSAQDTQYRFSHWLLPTGETITDSNFSLAVSAPGTITASYDTYYHLTFSTEPSGVTQMTGSGWYKAGYDLMTTAPAEVDSTPGTQYRFSHWLLPTGETASGRDLNLTVNAPGRVTASYDTYYQLTLKSDYGNVGGGTWYKAGSEAQWSFDSQKVPMPGALGAIGGKMQPINYSGTEVMDGPKSITIKWNCDYTRPALFFSLLSLGIGLAVFFGLRRRRHVPPAPMPVAVAPQPLPPPQTTVVMVGDASRRSSPQTTKEQLVDKFRELLDKYEKEIKVSVERPKPERLAKGKAEMDRERMLPEGQMPPSAGETEGMIEQEDQLASSVKCNYTGKRLLRVVAGPWRQVETKTTPLLPDDRDIPEGGIGITVVWARDIYNEWQILDCFLAHGHRGTHQGTLRLAYTPVNTVTEQQVYGSGERVVPPTPHFTDGMPEVGIAANQVIRYDQLPTEDLP